MADYYPLISNTVSGLGNNNTPEARQRIYERARAALVGLVSSELELASERLALEMAIGRFEEQASAGQSSPAKPLELAKRPEQAEIIIPHARRPSPLQRCHEGRKERAGLHPAFQHASTGLLIFSMFFAQYWAMDPTSMSLYWVLRAPLKLQA